jgi:hypothetical protein
MMMRRSDHEIVVRKEAAKFGASVIATGVTGGGHRYALIARAGARRKVFYPRHAFRSPRPAQPSTRNQS